MQARSIILGLAGLAVVVAFFLLIFDSQGPRSGQVDDAELDQALSEYQRSQKAGDSSSSQDQPRRNSTPRIPKTRARPRPSSEESNDSSTEPYTAPAPEVENEVFAEKVDMKTQMNEANRLYDKADYEGARDSALEILEASPHNVRMKRIVVSASCIMGDEDPAREHFGTLPTRDQRQMARRCKRYGIDFEVGQ